MPNIAVQMDHIFKSYDGAVKALNGLSLAMFDNEILGLIGPNGAGKTTSIKILVGLLRADSGKVTVLGQDIEADPISYKADIGYMPEAPSLPDYLTASEFLGYVARIRNVPKNQIAERVSKFLKDLDLTPKADETISTLSKGMRAKLAFAAATIHAPKLLILDEPLIGIDPAGQHLLKERISEIARKGGSVLVSTHQLDTAERLCTKVAIIHRGKNVATGDLAALRQQAHAGAEQSLEEIFLKLTEEAGQPEPEVPRRRGFFSRRR
jgi:ABC-2 type transport system ATP-binding protein